MIEAVLLVLFGIAFIIFPGVVYLLFRNRAAKKKTEPSTSAVNYVTIEETDPTAFLGLENDDQAKSVEVGGLRPARTTISSSPDEKSSLVFLDDNSDDLTRAFHFKGRVEDSEDGDDDKPYVQLGPPKGTFALDILSGVPSQDNKSEEEDDVGLLEAIGNPIPSEERTERDLNIRRVYFGTNRAKEGIYACHAAYGRQRGNTLRLGFTDISIPESRFVGVIDRPRWLRIFGLPLPLRQEEDIKKHFMEYATKELTVDAFKAEIKSAAKNNSSALVYIHGFNNSFQQAMFRAAQLGEDLSFDGHVFAYSWPARGGVRNYLTDMDSARLAVTHFDVFLDRIVENTGIETLHVIAHSMGNAVFSSLVERGGTKFSKRPGKFINQLILAAPDIDREVFEELAGLFRAQSEEVTLYASSRDMALQASETLHASYPRAGDVPGIGPLVIPGIDTMDVSAVETGLFSLKHNSHSDTDQVLNDVMARINGAGVPPDKRITNVRRVPHALGMHYFRFDPVKR